MAKTLAELQRSALKQGGGYWKPIGYHQRWEKIPGSRMQFQPSGEPEIIQRQWVPQTQTSGLANQSGTGLADLIYGQTMASRMADLGARGMYSSSQVGQYSAVARAQAQLAEYQYGEQIRQQRFNEYVQRQQLKMQRQQMRMQRAEANRLWNMFTRQLNRQDYWDYMQMMERNAPLPSPYGYGGASQGPVQRYGYPGYWTYNRGVWNKLPSYSEQPRYPYGRLAG